MNVERISLVLSNPSNDSVEAMMVICEISEAYTLCSDVAAQKSLTHTLRDVLPRTLSEQMLNIVADTPLLFLFVRLYRYVVATTPMYPLGTVLASAEPTLMKSVVPSVLRLREQSKLSNECRILLRLLRLKHRSHYNAAIVRTFPLAVLDTL